MAAPSTPPGARPRRAGRSRPRRALAIALGLLAGAVVFAPGVAWPESQSAPYIERGVFPTDPATPPLVASFAKVDVVGGLARVTRVELYVNVHPAPIALTYVFPGATRAAVTGMTAKVGDRQLAAEIRELPKVRVNYQEPREAGKTEAILERGGDRPNLLHVWVANVLPGELIRVEVESVERLHARDGEYELVVPAVVAGRHPRHWEHGSRGGGGVATDPRPAAWPLALPWRQLRGVSVDIRGPLPLTSVRSPSHPVTPLERPGSTLYHHGHTDVGGPPRDFVLRYRLGGDTVGVGVKKGCRVAPGSYPPGALTDPDVRDYRIRLFGSQVRHPELHRPTRDARWGQRVLAQGLVELLPGEAASLGPPTQPLPPEAHDLVAEASDRPRVPDEKRGQVYPIPIF